MFRLGVVELLLIVLLAGGLASGIYLATRLSRRQPPTSVE
jgi:hypothetical protein